MPNSYLPPTARMDLMRRLCRPLDEAALQALRLAFTNSPPYEEDYVNLAEVGLMLARIALDINARNYGFQRLLDLAEASGLFELRRKDTGPNPPVTLVRLKE